MRTKLIILFVFLFSFSMVSCAKKAVRAPKIAKTKVILLAEDDGSVGKITISNTAGSQVIDKEKHGVELFSAFEAPKPAEEVDAAKIEAEFGDALEAQPDPPATFLLYFISGKTVLTQESKDKIGEIMTDIKARTAPRINIVGHTDTQGGEEANYKLALKRAEIVKQWAMDAGISEEYIFEVNSHGESNPVVSTGDNVSEPRNRRVELIVR